MSNENKQTKPASRAPVDCPLIGEDGNYSDKDKTPIQAQQIL